MNHTGIILIYSNCKLRDEVNNTKDALTRTQLFRSTKLERDRCKSKIYMVRKIVDMSKVFRHTFPSFFPGLYNKVNLLTLRKLTPMTSCLTWPSSQRHIWIYALQYTNTDTNANNTLVSYLATYTKYKSISGREICLESSGPNNPCSI